MSTAAPSNHHTPWLPDGAGLLSTGGAAGAWARIGTLAGEAAGLKR